MFGLPTLSGPFETPLKHARGKPLSTLANNDVQLRNFSSDKELIVFFVYRFAYVHRWTPDDFFLVPFSVRVTRGVDRMQRHHAALQKVNKILIERHYN